MHRIIKFLSVLLTFVIFLFQFGIANAEISPARIVASNVAAESTVDSLTPKITGTLSIPINTSTARAVIYQGTPPPVYNGTLSFTDNTHFSYQERDQLSPGTYSQFMLTGVDTSGRSVSLSINFYVKAGMGVSAVKISSSTPKAGEVIKSLVPPKFEINFSQPVNTSTISATMTSTLSGLLLDSSGKVTVINPQKIYYQYSKQLPYPGESYDLMLSGKDMNSNRFDVNLRFSVAVGANKSSAKIVTVTPPAGSVIDNVKPTFDIVLDTDLDKSQTVVNISNITECCEANPKSKITFLSPRHFTFTTLDELHYPGDTYGFFINGKDTSGNIVRLSFNFKLKAGAGRSDISVLDSMPAENGKITTLKPHLELVLSRIIDLSQTKATLYGKSFNGYSSDSGELIFNSEKKLLVYNNSDDLIPGQSYVLSVVGKDNNGNNFTLNLNFLVDEGAQNSEIKVVASEPQNGDAVNVLTPVIKVQFDRDVIESELKAFVIGAEGKTIGVGKINTYKTKVGTKVYYKQEELLKTGTDYNFVISGKDSSGVSFSKNISFNTTLKAKKSKNILENIVDYFKGLFRRGL